MLLGCVIAGAGVTYMSGLPLAVEERLAYGTVIGGLGLAMIDFLLAMAIGLSIFSVLLGFGLLLSVSTLGWRLGWRRLPGEVDDAVSRWRRLEPWPLWILLAISWPFALVVLGRGYLYTSQGLITQGAGFYADWAAHLTYAGSFAFAHNFPPEFPVDPGHTMAYPFLIDLLAATLVPLGTSLTSALVLTSGLLALAFPAVMYLAATRFIGSRVGSVLAVLVFTLSGGLGFARLGWEIGRSGLTALHLPHGLYTQDNANNIQWLNPVLAWMLPQRSVLFGFSLALLVMAMLWMALRASPDAEENNRWAPFVFAGVVTGLTPLSHLHAYGTIVALAAFWTAFSPRRQWAGFFVPALFLGLPAVLWMASGGAASIHLQPGWLAHADNPSLSVPQRLLQDVGESIWFWLKNTGLLIPAMVAAFIWRKVLPARLALHLAPIWLWFLIPNILVFQPWDWDNTKFFAYWALFGALAVGALLVQLLGSGLSGRLAAYGLTFVLMASGALDLGSALNTNANAALFTGADGLQVAAWVRKHTDPMALFLTAPAHNDPVPTLGGRRVMVGYGGWLWTYGLADWEVRTRDATTILHGGPEAAQLLRRYGVDYVVLGPEDATIQGSNTAYFDRVATRVYTNGRYTVYRVR